MAKKVQINEAAREELAELPGIGQSTAETLIKLREERGGFKSIDELEDVPGIGAQTLQSIRSHVTVSKNGRAGARKPVEGATKVAEEAVKAADETTETVVANGQSAASPVIEVAREMTEQAAKSTHEQMEVAHETMGASMTKAHQATEEMAAAQHDMLGAMREAQELWVEVVQEQVMANVQAAQRLAACRTPQDLASLQVDYLRGSVERMVNCSMRVAGPAASFAGTWWSPERWQQFGQR